MKLNIRGYFSAPPRLSGNLTTILYLLILIPGMAIAQQECRIVPDVIYGHKSGMALTYDVFQPDSSNGAGIIHLVSGSWISRYMEPDSVLENYQPLLDQGYTVFALRHSSSPKFTVPEEADDVKQGAWHIYHNSYKFGVDSTRLGIFGGSSGGHLSLVAGLSGDSHPVRAIVAFFPPVDMRNLPDFLKKMIPALDFDTTLAASVSPILLASPDDPPTLLIHGDKDFVVDVSQSQKMYEVLQQNNVVSNLIIYEGMPHGNSYGAKGKYYEQATAEMIAWFRKYLIDKDLKE